jgi:ABC-2 type transport system ATP-binding protein
LAGAATTNRVSASDAVETVIAIETEGLTKVYRSGLKAVDDVTLRVPAGQVFGLLGPNGAGKTTTIKMLAGLVTPTKGRVRLNGYDVQQQRSHAVRQIGAVLEGARNVYWSLSAWQNLMYFGQLKGLSGGSIRPRAEFLLRSLDLWERRDDLVGKFSRGMQQKVAIAAALIADPPIVLLDEPTLGLDVEAARTVKDWVAELARTHGKTLLLTTHQLHVAEELCTQIAIIRRGQIVTDVPKDELLSRFRRENAYRITLRGEVRDLRLPEHFDVGYEDRATVISGPVRHSRELYAVLDDLRDQDLHLVSVEQVQPDLEQVFLQLISQEHRP